MAAAEGEGRRHHGRSFPALSLCLLLLASTVWSANADWCEGYKNIFNCILYHGSAACADNSKRKPAFWCTSGFTLGASVIVNRPSQLWQSSKSGSCSIPCQILIAKCSCAGDKCNLH